MIRRHQYITQRPEYFRLNPEHELSQGGLVFAGLGRFPGGYRYDDATESLWGGGNPGTLVVGTGDSAAGKWVLENGRRRVRLDGSDDYLQLPAIPEIVNAAKQFTYSAWLKITKSASSALWSAIPDAGYWTTDFMMYFTPDPSLNLQVNNGADGGAVWNGELRNQWHHVAIIYDGYGETNADRLKLFVDGVQRELSFGTYTVPSVGPSIAGTPIKLGTYPGMDWPFGGLMSDVCFWGSARSPAEIAVLASPDPMLGGWLLPPHRQSFAVAVADATSHYRRLVNARLLASKINGGMIGV